MNIMFFLTHKSEVKYLYDDMSMREGLGVLSKSGYHAIPLISRDGKYLGTVTEGDFLWATMERKEIIGGEKTASLHMIDLPRRCDNKPVHADAKIYHLLDQAAQQNFVPVVDGRDIFVGIVTRKRIFDYCKKKFDLE